MNGDEKLELLDHFSELAEQYEGFRQTLVAYGWPGDEAAHMVVLLTEHILWQARRATPTP